MGKIDEIVLRAKELGQSSIAITDHGSVSGWWEFQKTCKKHGIKPILGCEFYYERETDGKNGHLIVLAKDEVGIKNIFKMMESSYVDNFYRKPRINFKVLSDHKEGLIVSSACLASTPCQLIMEGKINEAEEWVLKFRDLLGEDFYLEIQSNNIAEQIPVNQHLLAFGKKHNIKVIATNDVHYVYEDDSYAHEVLLGLQTNKKLNDPKRWKFSTEDFWLKSYDEMISTFVGIDVEDVKSSLAVTNEIAEKCNAEMVRGKYLPKYYDIPKKETERSLLIKEAIRGAKSKGKNKNIPYMEAVQNEIDIIDEEGYSGYFLIVTDYITTARANGVIVGDGRGSGCGCKTGYLTDIHRIDPEEYDLLFERFMAHGREPDIDADFSDQSLVFKDLQSKYGVENVARIVAFGTMTPKAVSRKVLSFFEMDKFLINSVSKLIPDLCPNMDEAYESSPELVSIARKHESIFKIIDRLDGVISHESQHAGGVIIYPDLSSHLPLKTTAEDRNIRIVAFDKYMLEEIGHFKFDILGLITLPMIKNTLDLIEKTEGRTIDLYSIDKNDPKVYEMLQKGDVSGVFQLSNQAQKVVEQYPKNFKDLIAINALIRPGVADWNEYIARRNGKEYEIHPQRIQYMEETSGVMTYQEQFMLDCKVFAGWDLAYADKKVRKNKNILEDTELRDKFYTDCVVKGFEKDLAIELWDEICDAVSGGYSFNKSHSASYAVISYQTAWLKYYYPIEFYTALMNSEKTDGTGQEAISKYISECRERSIKVLPPDINSGTEEFLPTKEGIRYRLTSISHLGESAIQALHDMRPIQSFDDFLERRNKSKIKSNVVESIIKAGCFDGEEPNRCKLLHKFSMLNRTNKQIKEGNGIPELEWNNKTIVEFERESLGVYLTASPFDGLYDKPFDTYGEGMSIVQWGIIESSKVFLDKNKNEMAFITCTTKYGMVKLIVFAGNWKILKGHIDLDSNEPILIEGRRSGNDIIVEHMEERK